MRCVTFIAVAALVLLGGATFDKEARQEMLSDSSKLISQGESVFRFDTFGDQVFWGDTLHLHQAIEGAKLGGGWSRRLSDHRASRRLEGR
jgi:hypothetical protein